MTAWGMTAVIVCKSLWWIIPAILYVAVMAYMER